MKARISDRLFLLATGLLAAWQIAEGINSMNTLSIVAYTIGFGMLLVACLLLIILGFEALDNPVVALVSTTIPLSISVGLVCQNLTDICLPYLIFAIMAFLVIIISRIIPLPKKLPIILLSIVHGIAGITIVALPFFLVFSGRTAPVNLLVSLGGALIGVGGLLLLIEKAGAPLLAHTTLLKILPGLLLLATLAFIIGL